MAAMDLPVRLSMPPLKTFYPEPAGYRSPRAYVEPEPWAGACNCGRVGFVCPDHGTVTRMNGEVRPDRSIGPPGDAAAFFRACRRAAGGGPRP